MAGGVGATFHRMQMRRHCRLRHLRARVLLVGAVNEANGNDCIAGSKRNNHRYVETHLAGPRGTRPGSPSKPFSTSAMSHARFPRTPAPDPLSPAAQPRKAGCIHRDDKAMRAPAMRSWQAPPEQSAASPARFAGWTYLPEEIASPNDASMSFVFGSCRDAQVLTTFGCSLRRGDHAPEASTGSRQFRPCVSMAQTASVTLFASAIANRILGLRARNRECRDSPAIDCRSIPFSRDIVAIINKRRIPLWLAVNILPRHGTEPGGKAATPFGKS